MNKFQREFHTLMGHEGAEPQAILKNLPVKTMADTVRFLKWYRGEQFNLNRQWMGKQFWDPDRNEWFRVDYAHLDFYRKSRKGNAKIQGINIRVFVTWMSSQEKEWLFVVEASLPHDLYPVLITGLVLPDAKVIVSGSDVPVALNEYLTDPDLIELAREALVLDGQFTYEGHQINLAEDPNE